MGSSLRMAHLVVGALAVAAFLLSGMIMTGHEPPVAAMDWDQRLLFRSRHIYMLCGGLVNLALGLRFGLPERAWRMGIAVAGSLLVLLAAVALFFAFFAEPMAGREPGPVSFAGLVALFGGILLHVTVGLRRSPAQRA